MNEDLARIGLRARLTFIGLWTLADKQGRLEDRPDRIRAELFPYERVRLDRVLEELESGAFIIRYVDENGLHLIQIANFAKHQKPHHREPESVTKSPSPDIVGTSPGSSGSSRAVTSNQLPVTSNQNTVTPPTPPRGDVDAQVTALQNLWNECAKKAGWQKWGSTDKARRRQALARLREAPLEELRELLQGAIGHPHLRGENDRSWMADPEWFFTAKALRKLRDGSWNSRSNRPTATSKAMPSCPCCNNLMTTDRCARCDSGNCKKCLTSEKTRGAGRAGKMLKVLASKGSLS